MEYTHLTPMQLGALETIAMRGRLQAGWGGYGVRTLRSLEGRGLIRMDYRLRDATSITQRGRDVLARTTR